MKPLRAEERLIVALDFDSERGALEIVERLKGTVKTFKVGSELYASCGPGIVECIRKRNCAVFLDLKFHDIPTTVAKSVAAATRLGVSMLNVHASGGAEMMKAAAEALSLEARRSGLMPPKLIAVTVLTSLDRNGLKKVGMDGTIEKNVLRLARLAKASGLDGVVSSPHEIERIREELGEDFLIVTPGVRPSWAKSNDQKRIATPTEAILRGADYIVVGRPITGVENPAVACERIVEEMRGAKDHDH
jgi:orotidine-5'-phosphate decarboxylase